MVIKSSNFKGEKYRQTEKTEGSTEREFKLHDYFAYYILNIF